MIKLSVEKDTVLKRVNGIQMELSELQKLGALPYDKFLDGKGFELSQYHLHRALEGVFNIAAHILSRLPGGQATKYAEMAQKLGEFGIIDKNFAVTKLTEMAKYRNRLVHFYAVITSEEIYEILQNNLSDFDIFLAAIKEVLEHPEKFNLAVE